MGHAGQYVAEELVVAHADGVVGRVIPAHVIGVVAGERDIEVDGLEESSVDDRRAALVDNVIVEPDVAPIPRRHGHCAPHPELAVGQQRADTARAAAGVGEGLVND